MRLRAVERDVRDPQVVEAALVLALEQLTPFDTAIADALNVAGRN